jgi:type I restriction enzyme, S subunit
LKQLTSFIEDKAHGASALVHTQKWEMEGFQFPLPPAKAEQAAIAETLSDTDALIESLERLLAKKRHIKQGAMQELLTGKGRLPGFSGEWEEKPLGALATLYQPITISANQFTDAGFPVYGANGVVGFYGRPNHDTWQVTVTCRGSTCGTVNRTVDRCWITGNAMVLNCDQNKSLCKEFFYYLLCNQDLSDCITGTGQPQIVRSPLAAFCVPVPPTKAEQQAIAAILNDVDAEIAVLEAKLAKARNLKRGMMQELLTGRIRLV